MLPWAWLLLAVSLAGYGCACPHKTMSFEEQQRLQSHEWVFIAGINGGDKDLQKILRDTLNQNGILCLMVGSIGYDVLVPRALFDDARKVLDQNPELKGRLFGVVEHPR
jgi:hypothetical protein